MRLLTTALTFAFVIHPALGQDKKNALEDLLAKAKKNNPEIRLAEAQVEEAALRLSKTRLQVQNQVAALLADIEGAATLLKEADTRLQRAETLYRQGNMSVEELSTYHLAKIKCQTDLKRKEAEMPYLLGEPPAADWKNHKDLPKLALRQNPDVRLAEAQLLVAGRQEEKTRLHELNKVAVLVKQIDSLQAVLVQTKARLDRAQDGKLGQEELRTHQQAHQAARAQLAVAQARLPVLVGEVAK